MRIPVIVAGALGPGTPTPSPTGPADDLPNPFDALPLPFPVLLALVIAAGLILGGLGRLLYRALIPPDGFASAVEIRQEMSAASARAAIPQNRPVLAAEHGPMARRRLPVSSYSYPIGRALSPFMWVRGTPQDSAMVIGPPGSSKTVWMTSAVIDAPGAVVHTSSKIEDHEQTARFREEVGPVYLFNPQGLGGVPSTVRFNPVRGCEDYDVAKERAALMLYGAREAGQHAKVSDYFESNAGEVFAAHLYAAALGGLTLVDCHRWANDPDDDEPLVILDRMGGSPTVISVLRGRMTVVDRTRDAIFSSLATSLKWMTGEQAAWCVSPPPGDEFDVAEFIGQRGTLYLVAEDRPDSVAPLFTLVMTLIIREAQTVAAASPGRRLDPWLTLALDEIATICPLPLESWVARVRSHGILPILAIQSLGQLVHRWGPTGGDIIESVVAFTLVLRGIKAPDDLRGLSELCGEREERRRTVQRGPAGLVRTEHTELRPVLPPHKIRRLRRGRMLVIYRGAAPVIVRVTKHWKRRDLRRRSAALQRSRPDAAVTAPGSFGRPEVDPRG